MLNAKMEGFLGENRLYFYIYSGKKQIKNRFFPALVELIESNCDKIVLTITRNDMEEFNDQKKA